MKLSILIIKFLFIGALFIVSNENLHLKDTNEREAFFQHYYDWLNTLFAHATQITAYVTNSEWLPGTNQTTFAAKQR